MAEHVAGEDEFRTELGPVFCNFLLADEINRAPAKVQSALLEVMQERQVTIGHETHRVPAPFLVLATQNPIESEGTYPLPEAQVDRFMFKLIVDYPAARDEVSVVERSLLGGTEVREVLSASQLARHQRAAHGVYVDRRVMEYAVALTTATREPSENNWVEFGASPRGSINLVHAGRALALLRGRDYVLPTDVRDLARDVLRHRIVLTYEALAAGVDADRVLDDVLEAIPVPRIELADEAARAGRGASASPCCSPRCCWSRSPCSPTGGRSAGGGATPSATPPWTCSPRWPAAPGGATSPPRSRSPPSPCSRSPSRGPSAPSRSSSGRARSCSCRTPRCR